MRLTDAPQLRRYRGRTITKFREFKAIKRQELRRLIKLFDDEIRLGSFYLPDQARERIYRAHHLLREAQAIMSVKHWGR